MGYGKSSLFPLRSYWNSAATASAGFPYASAIIAVDAITGEGLGLSFRQAAVLAQSLRSGNLTRYQGVHRRLARRPLMMARLMLMLNGRPKLQRHALQLFRRRPQVFRKLLALHVGSLSPFHVALDGITLGWQAWTA